MGAPATDLHEALIPFAKEDTIFEKTTYSALKSEMLVEYLKKYKVNTLHLCGVSLDACILATAYEAFDLGYEVKILENLCAISSFRDDYEDAAKTIIKRNLVKKEVRFEDR